MPSGHKPGKRVKGTFSKGDTHHIHVRYKWNSIWRHENQFRYHKSTCIDKVCPVITEEVSEVDEGGLQMMANC